MQVLGVVRTMIWRARAAYVKGGLAHLLVDVQLPGKPRRYRKEVEAQITTLPLLGASCRRLLRRVEFHYLT